MDLSYEGNNGYGLEYFSRERIVSRKRKKLK